MRDLRSLEPWRQECADLAAAARPFESGANPLLFNDDDRRRALDPAPRREIAARLIVDSVQREGLVIASVLQPLCKEPFSPA